MACTVIIQPLRTANEGVLMISRLSAFHDNRSQTLAYRNTAFKSVAAFHAIILSAMGRYLLVDTARARHAEDNGVTQVIISYSVIRRRREVSGS